MIYFGIYLKWLTTCVSKEFLDSLKNYTICSAHFPNERLYTREKFMHGRTHNLSYFLLFSWLLAHLGPNVAGWLGWLIFHRNVWVGLSIVGWLVGWLAACLFGSHCGLLVDQRDGWSVHRKVWGSSIPASSIGKFEVLTCSHLSLNGHTGI